MKSAVIVFSKETTDYVAVQTANPLSGLLNQENPFLFCFLWQFLPAYPISFMPSMHIIFLALNAFMWVMLYRSFITNPGYLPKNSPDYDRAIRQASTLRLSKCTLKCTLSKCTLITLCLHSGYNLGTVWKYLLHAPVTHHDTQHKVLPHTFSLLFLRTFVYACRNVLTRHTSADI